MGNTPDNNSRNQYLKLNGCNSKFSSERFDQKLANNRITKIEVNGFLQTLNSKFQKDLKKEIKIIIWYFIWFVILEAAFLYFFLTKDDKNSKDMTPTQTIILVSYLVLVLIMIIILSLLLFNNQKKVQNKIQKYLIEMNDSFYENRGILWNIIYQNKSKYMQLIFIQPAIQKEIIQGKCILPIGQPLLT